MRPVVVGGRGFLGQAVVSALRRRGYEPRSITHGEVLDEPAATGLVVYCSGLAWGAEQDPDGARAAHVETPRRFLEQVRPDMFVYASSTRVYDAAASTSEARLAPEESPTTSVYAATKYAGERVVLAASPRYRVARLSNLSGASTRSQLLVSDLVRQAVTTGSISLRSALDSSKDYVTVTDAAEQMVRIAEGSRHRVYNVGAGSNTTHRAWVDAIRANLPQVEVDVAEGSPTLVTPTIDVSRLREEFAYTPRDVLAEMPAIIEAFRASEGSRSDVDTQP